MCELERNPHALFYERDLRARFGTEFDGAVEAGLLRFVQPPEHGGSLVLPDGRRLSVMERDGQFWGVDDGEDEADPVPLTAADLSRYRLSLDTVATRLREANELQGEACEVGDRLYYLGFRQREGIHSAVLLALFATEHAAHDTALSVPTRASGDHQQYILVCPSFALRDQAELRRLQDANVFLCRLDEDDVWRIAWPSTPVHATSDVRSSALLVIYGDGTVVEYCGQRLTPTAREGAVLLALAQRPKKPTFMPDLLATVWRGELDAERSLRTVISRLRRKLSDAATKARAAGRQVPDEVILTHKGTSEGTGSYELLLYPAQVRIVP